MPDFHVINHGSIFTFAPLTPAAQDWWDDNVDPENPTLGGAYAVESRYASAIAEALFEEGLTIQ